MSKSIQPLEIFSIDLGIARKRRARRVGFLDFSSPFVMTTPAWIDRCRSED